MHLVLVGICRKLNEDEHLNLDDGKDEGGGDDGDDVEILLSAMNELDGYTSHETDCSRENEGKGVEEITLHVLRTT